MEGNQNNSLRFYDILQYNVILILFPDFSSSCGMSHHILGPSYMEVGDKRRVWWFVFELTNQICRKERENASRLVLVWLVAKLINALLLSLAALAVILQCYGCLLSIAKQPPKAVTWIWPEFDVTRIRPRLGGLPHLETFWEKFKPDREGYPVWLTEQPYDWLVKIRDYMDRRVTPPKRLTWGPPPPCKQALGVRTG